MAFYYACFAAIALCQLGTRRTVAIRLAAACFAMFLVAGFRSERVDKDYQGYIEYYGSVLDSDFANVEPTFIWLSQLVRASGDNTLLLFVIYAALGIALKMFGIFRLSRFPVASLLVYYSGFFLLWEMTQIRAAVAGGILLLCIVYIQQRKLVPFLLLCLLAVMFHLAALVFIPLFLLKPDRAHPLAYYALIPVGAVLYLAGFDIVEVADLAPLQLIELKIRSYQTYADSDVDNIFNAVYLARCTLALLLFANRDWLSTKNEHFLLMIKMYVIALFLHVALASIPGIAGRLSELLLVVEVILIPMLVHFFRERLIGYAVVVAAGLTFLTFSLHYTELLAPYQLAGGDLL